MVRGGELREISSANLVPGDIVVLSAGNRVPADGRLLEALNLAIDESSLTGESTPSWKDSESLLPEDCPLGDRRNMVFSGTLVASGKGKTVIVATGSRSEIGRIAKLTESVEEKPTQLQVKISQLTKLIAIAVVSFTILTVLLGILRGLAPTQSVLVGLSLLVVTIPEDLPILVFVILVASVTQMTRKKALVRKLYSAETLGSTSIICSDKTGTLTQSTMTVRTVSARGSSLDLLENPANPQRDVFSELAAIATLCNDSSPKKDPGQSAIGNAVDLALLEAVVGMGFDPWAIRQGAELLREEPFDNTRKMMSTLYKLLDGSVKFFA